MTDRKATDVLLNIEQMVEKILGHNRNQDLLIKTMLNRIQTLEEKLEVAQRVSDRTPSALQEDFPKYSGDEPPRRINPQLPGLKPGVKINSNNNHQAQITRDPNDEDESKMLELETKPQGKRRDFRYVPVESNGKPIPVQQKLLYSDGRCIATAKVEIFDEKSNLIKTLKTNATGKWTNALVPGRYIVRVSKKGTSTKNAVEAQVEVTIPDSSEPVQLKPFQVV